VVVGLIYGLAYTYGFQVELIRRWLDYATLNKGQAMDTVV